MIPRIEIPYIVRCDEECKKQIRAETIMEMNPADYYLRDMIEYVTDRV